MHQDRQASKPKDRHQQKMRKHQNDALGYTIGLEVVRLMEKDRLIERSEKIGRYFAQRLEELKAKHSQQIAEVRARGLMIAVERETQAMAENSYQQLIEAGFLAGQKEKTIRFMPALVIEKEDIDRLAARLDEIINGLN